LPLIPAADVSDNLDMGTNHARILIVEDDEALARQLKNHLDRAGYDVHAEHSGKAALLTASEHSMDLVILDLVLPDMSGYDVCLELRRIYHPWILPVVMLTALNQPKDQLLGFSLGAEAYLMKPIAPSELLSTIEVMLSRVERRAS
jgi:DNA-binding response OmpR family regulator